MPAELDACVKKLVGKGKDEKSAWAICKSSLDMAKDPSNIEEITKKAEEMCDEMDKQKMMSEQYGELKGVDIFAAGRWNGDEYTVDDLDKIVSSFNETKEKLKPYLKLGHGNEQKLLKEDELPAAGFVQNIYRSGRKILADISHIPSKIYELIKKKAYNKVSVELYKDIPIEGKKYEWALKAIALLGGATPAVHDLNDILALYSKENSILAFSTDAELKRFDIELQTFQEEDKKMEELQKQIELLQGEVKKFTEEVAELKAENEKIKTELETSKKFGEEATAKIASYEKEKKMAAIDGKVKEFIEAKKIIPAQAEKLKVILSELPSEKKFSIGEKEFNSLEEVILSFIADGEKVGLPTTGQTEVGKTTEEDMDLKAKKYMAENKVSYKEAVIALANESIK